jgi:hypothetical protein
MDATSTTAALRRRPKSVSFVALSFALFSLFLGVASIVRVGLFGIHYRLFHLVIAVLLLTLAVAFASVAIALWNLSRWSRLLAVLFAGLNICFFGYAMARPEARAERASFGREEREGSIFGIAMMFLWLASPIYILTRPSVVNAFSTSHRSNQAMQRTAPRSDA